MKENKLLILGTLIVTFALYFITYSSVEDAASYKTLTNEELKFFFNDLDEEQKEGIASTPIDSLKSEYFSDSLTYSVIKNMHKNTYETFQKISRESLDIEQSLHVYRRLILILYLVLGSYFVYTKKYKFNITFQKAMYHNVIFSLIFALFCIFSFVLTQTIRGTANGSPILLQFGFAHFIEVLKSTLIWFILVSFFIYFHPQNIDWYKRRMEKKKKKEEKLQADK